MVLRQWFTAVCGLLDEMLARYPAADAAQRSAIEAETRRIQRMSDAVIDGWLKVEERLAKLRGMTASAGTEAVGPEPGAAIGGNGDAAREPAGVPSAPAAAGQGMAAVGEAGAHSPAAREEADRHLTVGRGYYELAMYREAAAAFRKAVELRPESLAARLFLAISHLHLGEWEDAERQFRVVVRKAPSPKLKALGLNALGCIRAVNADPRRAAHYFRQACAADPEFTGAARNLAICMANAGPLTLNFGGSGFG